MIRDTIKFRLVLRCLLVARKENLTGFSTGLTGRSKNLDSTSNPTGRSTRPVFISGPEKWNSEVIICCSSSGVVMASRNFFEVILKIIGKFFVDVFVHKFGRFNFIYIIDFEDFVFLKVNDIYKCYILMICFRLYAANANFWVYLLLSPMFRLFFSDEETKTNIYFKE